MPLFSAAINRCIFAIGHDHTDYWNFEESDFNQNFR